MAMHAAGLPSQQQTTQQRFQGITPFLTLFLKTAPVELFQADIDAMSVRPV